MPSAPGQHRAAHRRSPLRRALGLPTLGALALSTAVSGAVTTGPTATESAQQPTAAEVTPQERNTTRTPPERTPPVSRGATRRQGSAVKAAERLKRRRTRSLAGIERRAEKYKRFLEANQWVMPLDSYDLTATFGQMSSLWSTSHTGLDFAADSGTPIRAIASGTVTETGYSDAYGERTVLTSEDGTEFWYCHQSAILVTEGESVGTGEVIGEVGSTGNVTGPHLHLEVRPAGGGPIDPAGAMESQGLAP